jgi:hypothetical protein
MKTKKKTITFISSKLPLALSSLLIVLFAFSKPEYMFPEHSRYNNKPDIFRPILDSSIVCSWHETWSGEYELDFFYIVEHMPGPRIPIDIIENILEKEIGLNAKELSYNDTIGFQCVVNCNGKAGDFQILKCPDEFVNIGCQVLNILRTQLSEWEPPVQRDKPVDLLALIAVIVNNGQFKVIAPVY